MTSNIENYRSSKEFREILRILQKASSLQENFLWQSHANGKNIIPIHHFEIDFVSREVVVYIDSQQHILDTSIPLYVKLDYRTSVFKITEYRQSQNSIYFSIPFEIKTKEMRNNPRYLVDPEDEKYVYLKSSLSGLNFESGGGLQVRALDISYFGLGLIVSEQNRSYLKNNRILWITQVHEVTLETPILAEVVYINGEIEGRYRSKRLKELKVGLKLSGVFTEDVLNQFIQ